MVYLLSSYLTEIRMPLLSSEDYILVAVITILLCAIFWIIFYQNGKLPPGPCGLPLLGHLLHIVKDPHLQLAKWGKKYGKMYTIRLGTKNTVVLCDPKVIHDIFSQPAATGKFQTDTILLVSRGRYGVLSSEGKAWEELRRFCIRSLRSFGLGNKSVEPIILNEAQALIDWIKENRSSDKGSVILRNILDYSAGNTLWTMVTGEKLPLEDNKGHMNKLMQVYEKAIQRTAKTGLMFFPSIKYIAPCLSGFNEFDKITKEIHEFIQELFDEHKKTRVKGSPRDVIDCYIDQIENTTDPKSSFYGNLGEINSVSSIMELFLAGMKSSSITINWTTIFLATEPDVQGRLREEIYDVIGKKKIGNPVWRTKAGRMPYADAVMLEVFRHSSLAPLGVIHELKDDLTYEDYVLPRGTALLPNLHGVHYDERIWKDSKSFLPSRFLEDGHEKLRQSLVPFQPGKKSCLGEPLIKDVLFLFMAKLVQNFHILPDPNTSIEKYYETDVGLVITAGPHNIIFKDID